LKPGNAGGGKDPDFWYAFEEGKVKVIGDEPANTDYHPGPSEKAVSRCEEREHAAQMTLAVSDLFRVLIGLKLQVMGRCANSARNVMYARWPHVQRAPSAEVRPISANEHSPIQIPNGAILVNVGFLETNFAFLGKKNRGFTFSEHSNWAGSTQLTRAVLVLCDGIFDGPECDVGQSK
jgi:hypothetical protein